MIQINCSLHLPIFKQGDDLGHYLTSGLSNAESLNAYADQLNEASEVLRKVALTVEGNQAVEIEADCHCIFINGPEDVLRPLIESGILDEEEDFEDEDYEDDDDFDEDEDEEEE